MPINETLRFDVSWNGTNRASQSATIVDTSLPAYEYYLVGSNPSNTSIAEIDMPTYAIASNVGNVNEGGSVTFTLTTTMLDTGTNVPYTISGVSVSDISLSSLTGNFVTQANGQGTLTFTITEDQLTEGVETLVITLDGKNVSKSITINDTSINPPTYTLTSSAASVNEGSTIVFTLTTTNVSNGTAVAYAISGVSLSDVNLPSLTGNFTVQNNTASLSIPVVADLTTEGSETLTVTLTGKSVSKSVLVNDTSLTPVLASTTGLFRASDATILREMVIGPGEKLLLQISGGTGGHAPSYGLYGATALGFPSSDTALLKPGTNWSGILGNYFLSNYTWNNDDKSQTYDHYGEMTSRFTGNNVSQYLAYSTASPPSGYYADDFGGAGDWYLDNSWGGGTGGADTSSATGLVISNVMKLESKLSTLTWGPMTWAYNDIDAENEVHRPIMLQFNLTNTTNANITIPVQIGTNVVPIYNLVRGYIGYIRIINETNSATNNKASFTYDVNVTDNNRANYTLNKLSDVTLSNVTLTLVSTSQGAAGFKIYAADNTTLIGSTTGNGTVTIPSAHYGKFYVAGNGNYIKVTLNAESNKGNITHTWEY